VTDINRPLLGEPNAPCRSCGSPLAADQRYCLQCGARRAEARLPFLDILARQVPAAPAAATTTTTSTTWLGRMSTNAAAVAGVACLLLALGVGVLIGGLGQDDSAASSGAPQVISVGGGGAAAPAVAATSAAPAATETTTDAATTTTAKDTKKSKSSSSGSSSSKSTNSAVKKLDSSTGGDYTKKSAKLPKTLGTGGKAPPVDKSGTKIGGGSATEEIG
jgi:hypothetical protein